MSDGSEEYVVNSNRLGKTLSRWRRVRIPSDRIQGGLIFVSTG